MQGGGQRAGNGVCQADATRRLIHSDTLSEHGHTHSEFPRHTHTQTHTPPIGYTHFPLVHRRGEARREGYPLTRHTHTDSTALQHKSGISWKPLRRSVPSSASFESWSSVCLENHFHLKTRIKVLHLPLRGRNSSGLF